MCMLILTHLPSFLFFVDLALIVENLDVITESRVPVTVLLPSVGKQLRFILI